MSLIVRFRLSRKDLKELHQQPQSFDDIELIMDDDIEYEIDNNNWFERGYISIDRTETNGSTNWPKSTNIKCWHCTLIPDEPPLGFPTNIESGVFQTYGCFCSFQCALTYNRQYKNGENEDKLKYLYKLFGHQGKINIAPPKIIMIEYGGQYTREAYRKLLNGNFVVKELAPAIMPLPPNFSIGEKKYVISRKKMPFNIGRIN